MKKLLAFFSLCILYLQVVSQEISSAPLNQDFIDYINSTSKAPKVTSEGYALGELPSPHSYFFGNKIASVINPDFDAVYDLRTAGPGGTSHLSPVKNQSSCGSCWTFATCASIESQWIKSLYGTFDLSENNLKECHNFDYLSCDGGNIDMSTAYLSRGSGPIAESDDPYSAVDGSCNSGFTPVAYITDARFVPNDMATLKQALIDYGALYSNMYYDDAYYTSASKTYYYNGSSGTNHGVTLVGWDDNKVTAGGTGAWIIKNSWGSAWGESGYFYISYNDTKVNSTVGFFPVRIDYDPQTEVYFYDDFGDIARFGYGSNSAYACVKYTATADQLINKIGTYAEASNAVIGMEVYDNFNGSTFSGLLGTISNQNCSFPGYYTFDLPTPINISSGNDFFIKVYYETPGYNFPIPVEYAVAGYCSAAVVETGKCWSSSSGAGWTALGEGTSFVRDLCIKVYAENKLSPTIITDPSASNICNGENTGFTVSATGSSLSYQWQLSTDGGGNWSDLSEAAPYSDVTTSSLTITNTSLNMNLYQYRCVVTNSYGSSISNEATLTVNTVPSIATQPSDSNTCEGMDVSFYLLADGTSPSYQWQLSTTGGSSWTNISDTPPYSGSATDELSISPTAAGMNNYLYHCIVSNMCSTNSVSDNVLLSINTVPLIDLGNDQYVCAGDNALLDPGPGYDTYEWSTGEASQSISIDSAGTGIGSTTIYLTVTGGTCSNTDSVAIYFDDCTGITTDQNILGLSLFPNPSDKFIHVQLMQPQPGTTISISDMQGREVIQMTTGEKNIDINVASLTPGIYSIHISNALLNFSRTIVIAREGSE